jgi:RNA polymerase sigma factor (sigma-70 family)
MSVKTAERGVKVKAMLQDNITIARQIASRLRRRYTWVPMDDLYSYALLGLTMSANAYDPTRGVPFPNFASQKGMFWAIDHMRKDGILRRRSSTNMPRVLPFSEATGNIDSDSWTPEVHDDRADEASRQMEVRDLCTALMGQLADRDRKLLVMYYHDHMTFKEIARVFDISESSVCLRHKALIQRLRRLATAMRVA